MDRPSVPTPQFGASKHLRSILLLGLILPLGVLFEQSYIMRSHSRISFMAAMAASWAGNTVADADAAVAVDLSWHAPSSTALNDLSQVLSGTGVYGFIYNSSTTPDKQYGTYNWCNMPHVRATEYKKPSPEYKLQYVEVVCILLHKPQRGPCADYTCRFIDIINVRSTLQTLFQLNRMAGIVMMKVSSTMANLRLERSQPTPTGRGIFRPSTHLCQLGS